MLLAFCLTEDWFFEESLILILVWDEFNQIMVFNEYFKACKIYNNGFQRYLAIEVVQIPLSKNKGILNRSRTTGR